MSCVIWNLFLWFNPDHNRAFIYYSNRCFFNSSLTVYSKGDTCTHLRLSAPGPLSRPVREPAVAFSVWMCCSRVLGGARYIPVRHSIRHSQGRSRKMLSLRCGMEPACPAMLRCSAPPTLPPCAAAPPHRLCRRAAPPLRCEPCYCRCHRSGESRGRREQGHEQGAAPGEGVEGESREKRRRRGHWRGSAAPPSCRRGPRLLLTACCASIPPRAAPSPPPHPSPAPPQPLLLYATAR